MHFLSLDDLFLALKIQINTASTTIWETDKW